MHDDQQRYINLLDKEYILATAPDYDAISSILMIAKGNRIMKDFARITGINESTLSRILNHKTKYSISPLNIARISACAENNNDEIFFALAQANGYIRFDGVKMIRDRETLLNAHDLVSAKYSMSYILKAALLDRGITISEKNATSSKLETDSITSVPDFDMTLNIHNDGEPYTWNIYLVPDNNMSEAVSLDEVLDQMMTDLARVFVIDAWQDELLQSVKISVIVRNAALYQAFYQKMTQAKFHNWFSICLMDDDDQIWETQIGESENNKRESIFSLQPKSIDKIKPDSGILNRFMHIRQNQPSILDKKALGKKIKRKTEKRLLKNPDHKSFIYQTYHIDESTYADVINGENWLPDSLFVDIAIQAGISWKGYEIERQFFIQHLFAPCMFSCIIILSIHYCTWVFDLISIKAADIAEAFLFGVLCIIMEIWLHKKWLLPLGIFFFILGALLCR